MDKAQVRAIQLVETREDAAKLFEFVETAFDQVPFAIAPSIVGTPDFGPLMRWDDRFAAALLDVRNQVYCRIPTIRNHPFEGEPIE